jgi:moderate conductance mechanosensitive channel
MAADHGVSSRPVPDLTQQSTALVEWLSTNGIALAIFAIVLLVVYRWARPAIHRVLVNVMHAQSVTLGEGADRRSETDRRVETIEDLLAKVLRFGVVAALVVVILGIFDLWPVLAGLGLMIAAITLAGQNIVLDYLMGFLILVEGQYFKGDVVRVGAVEGTVEEVGLRRTVVRDARGTLHSISNGEIRSSANFTRTYAVATIHIDGIADADIERAMGVMDVVGAAVAGDSAWAAQVLEPPGPSSIARLQAGGATLRLGVRVRPEARIAIEADLRRKVAAGLAEAGIEPIRPAVPLGTAGGPGP